MTKSLPQQASLTSLKYQAKQVLKQHRANNPDACPTLRLLIRFSGKPDTEIFTEQVKLTDAQHALALDYGFVSWNHLREHVDSITDPAELTLHQHKQFHANGFVQLNGVVSVEETNDMHTRLWTLLENRGQMKDDPSTWTSGPGGYRLSDMRKADVAPKSNKQLGYALNVLFGDNHWGNGATWAQTLLTFPKPDETWKVPTSVWHVDFAYRHNEFVSGVNVLLFVDDVAKGGGGTCVAQGSQHAIKNFMAEYPDLKKEKQAVITKQLYATHPWFNELKGKPSLADRNQRLMDQDTLVNDIPLRVVELTGKAGDVVILHPSLIHCMSPNVLDKPRVMRACRLFHDSIPGGNVFDPTVQRPKLPEWANNLPDVAGS
jgi:hypothetical protein